MAAWRDMPKLAEDARLALMAQLSAFKDGDEDSTEFSSTLSSDERKFLHLHCKRMGLVSRSRGKGDNRFITVSKQTTKGSSLEHQARSERKTTENKTFIFM